MHRAAFGQTKNNKSAQTPHFNLQAQWWRGDMAYFEGTGTGHLAVNESNMNLSVDESRSATA